MIFWEIYYLFFQIGLICFGGGYAMIPLMRRELIERQGWLSLEKFLDIMAIAEMTPGPIAINTATFIGYEVAGIGGSLLATLGVISPSIIILGLTFYLSKKVAPVSWREALLMGIRPAAIALIFLAAVYLGEAVLLDLYQGAFFIGSLVLLFMTRISPIYLILLAGTLAILLDQLLRII